LLSYKLSVVHIINVYVLLHTCLTKPNPRLVGLGLFNRQKIFFIAVHQF